MRYTNLLLWALAASTELGANAQPVFSERDLITLPDGRVLSPRDPDWKNTAGQAALSCAAGMIALATGCVAGGGAGIAAGVGGAVTGAGIGILQGKQALEEKKKEDEEKKKQNDVEAGHKKDDDAGKPAPKPEEHPTPFHTIPEEPNPWKDHKPEKPVKPIKQD